MRDNRERLADILEAVEHIERYASRGRAAFEQDELIQTWIVHHLAIIGEAASRLGNAFHEANPQVPWEQIIAMRNILVHDYFAVDLDVVWATVQRDLPELKSRISNLVASSAGTTRKHD